MIPYGKQCIDEDDIEAVVKVLRSDWLTQGPAVETFEKALASYCGAEYAVAVSSGTAALHIACLAAGISAGDEVITSPITFVASANAAAYCGATPLFADIESDTILINPLEVQKRISNKTRAIIPVHYSGLSCDMTSLKSIADQHRLTIIEDACHALGAEWLDSCNNRHKVGSCSHSDMTVLSFHPVKHITTGEGGAVLTNSREYYEKLLMLRSHGITKQAETFSQPKEAFDASGQANPWYYEMQQLGYNYRITDIQCALGLSQLHKLDTFVARRGEIAARYDNAFANNPVITTPYRDKARQSSYHLYAVRIDFRQTGLSRAAFMHTLREKGVGSQVHYIPVHIQPYYRQTYGYETGQYPNAESYYAEALSLPIYPSMNNEEVDCVIGAVNELCNAK